MKYNWKINHTTHPTIKLNHIAIIFFIEKEWFSDTNLSDGANFPTALIKCAKYK